MKTECEISSALKRISPFIADTPIIFSQELNDLLGHEFLFKLENLQVSGSFKVRGILSSLTKLKGTSDFPNKVVTYGTGNHGVALSFACKKIFNIDVEVFLPKFASHVKIDKIIANGGKITITQTRDEAEQKALEAGAEPGCFLLPPSDNDEIIYGAGTIAYEVLSQVDDIDAVFVPIGGGGLASGTLLAKNALSPNTKVFASEPLNANDAARSYRDNKIFRFAQSPQTIADGATTLGVVPRVFEHIKQLDGIFEITEYEIEYWTAWFWKLTKIQCEPTSSLALAGAFRFVSNIKDKQKILIVVTGNNFDSSIYSDIASKDYLSVCPTNLRY